MLLKPYLCQCQKSQRCFGRTEKDDLRNIALTYDDLILNGVVKL